VPGRPLSKHRQAHPQDSENGEGARAVVAGHERLEAGVVVGTLVRTDAQLSRAWTAVEGAWELLQEGH
jgi:cytochrome b